MATSSDPPATEEAPAVGMDHPTVVPTNFEAPETDGDDATGE